MATETFTTQTTINSAPEETQAQTHRKPLQLKGVLEDFSYFDVTPVIGREFSNVNLKEWLRAPNSDDIIRDLAVTSKSRNISVCFLR